jgi:hypothetical protein
MATPEGKVKAKVNKILAAHGANVYSYMPVKSQFGAKTIDYLICAYGYYLGIETKAPGKHPTPLQWQHIRRIVSSGGLVFVIDGDTTALEKFLASARIGQAQTPRGSVFGTDQKPVSLCAGDGQIPPGAARSRRKLPAA